jgi:hypothetical protein
MTGAHRSTTQDRVAGGLKSASWLMTVIGVIMVPLALLALAIYLPIALHAGLQPYTIAVQSLTCALALGKLAWILLRKRGRSPEDLVRLIAQAGVWLCLVTTLLADISQEQGWLHGAYRYAVDAISGLFLLGIPLYCFGGKRRLTAILTARDADRQWPT